MRILLVNDKYPPETEAVSSIVADYAREFARLGHEVTVFTTHGDASASGPIRTKRDGIDVFAIPRRTRSAFARSWVPLFDPSILVPFKRFLRELKPDVVHFHNIHQHLSFPMVGQARTTGAATFLTAHDVMLFNYGKLVEFIDPKDLSCPETFDYRITARQQLVHYRKWYNPFRRTLIRTFLKPADTVLAVSEALRQALNQNNVRAEAVVHNGLNLERWKADTEAVRRFKSTHGLEGKSVILFGGRLSGWKGGAQMLSAMPKVLARNPNAILLVVGERTDYSETMKRLAEQLGIASRVIFAGKLPRAEMATAYGASTVVAVPSICFDSLPTIALEAMACRKPVVATCFGGAREIVVDGETGYIINPFDSEALVNRILDILGDPAKAERFGAAGYKRVDEYFSLARQTAELLRRYARARDDRAANQ